MHFELFLFILFDLIYAINSKSIQFSQPLQRFVYDDLTDTIILASVNHIYSLNASDLTIQSDVNTSPSETDHQCPITNKTSTLNNVYHFPTTSYLSINSNSTFNQLLLLNNDSVLICSTSNRGGSCQLRSLIDLKLLKTTAQRVVSSSPNFPSIGFISRSNSVLYVANTYDNVCDPFYEIPTISGRLIDDHFLSIINFNSGQSALQQSTYTLRLLNIRLIKEYLLHYMYAFEHEKFSYFLTIQQTDLHHGRKYRLQTKILRFCQTLKQPILKSFVEIPLTCGKMHHYLVNAKFDEKNMILYGIFRNTTLATAGNTSHAVCAYSMDKIRQAFFQTIKHCLVDGKGHRGLGYISPDVQCIANKKLNEINHDYCPDEDDNFFQYPIGGHRPLEQIDPIIELSNHVNFTSIEIASIHNGQLIFLGDDHGTLHTFHTSNVDEIHRQQFDPSIIVDLKLINNKAELRHASLLVLTNHQLIKQNLTSCEQYSTCDQCFRAPFCHWCSKENRCAASFECIDDNQQDFRRFPDINLCLSIERVTPQFISVDSSNKQFEATLNVPLGDTVNDYECRFQIESSNTIIHTEIVKNRDNVVQCASPTFIPSSEATQDIAFSIYQKKYNLTFGYHRLELINCSNFISCSSCTSHSEYCRWNLQFVRCQSSQSTVTPRKRFVTQAEHCPRVYLQQSINRLAYNMNHTLSIDFDRCQEVFDVDYCQLTSSKDRLSFFSLSSTMKRLSNTTDLCQVKCSFELSSKTEQTTQFNFQRPIHFNLSIQLSNQTLINLTRSHISVYHCELMASNCTSCLQLDPTYGCVWCNNMCTLKNRNLAENNICIHNDECLTPVIETIEPLFLPMNGGSLVTIKGKHFDLYNLSIFIGNVPCRLIEEDSSREKIVCQSGDAGLSNKTDSVYLNFGLHGPKLKSHQIISYVNPQIDSIEPLIGIRNGGTILTIQGKDLAIGNHQVSILIGNRPCQLVSVDSKKIQCQTSSFPTVIDDELKSIQIHFDRQTKIISKQFFRVVSNPKLKSFSISSPFRSFISGGHQIVIDGENLNFVQNIRLEFRRTIYVSPIFHNETRLIFLSPSVQELYLNDANEYESIVEMRLHLDSYNETSSIVYLNDPLIFELEPMSQSYTESLSIFGVNLTAIGHNKDNIIVHIGCDVCPISELTNDRLVCRPPHSRPGKYSKNNRVCYESEHPWIIVTIDNIHSHVGYMIYPKRLIILGIITGCLLTILLVISIVLIVVCVRVRCKKRRDGHRYFYDEKLGHQIEKQTFQPILMNKNYRKLNPIDLSNVDSLTMNKVPIRSYVDYLQYAFYFDLNDKTTTYDLPKAQRKEELIDQFQFFLSNHQIFVDSLVESLLKSNNRKLLNSLLLTQRYDLKKFLKFNDDRIYFGICLLTAYDNLMTSQTASFIYKVFQKLKIKIESGPVDVIEENSSYFSLNGETIIKDQSIMFNSIEILVHVDYQNGEEFLSIPVHCLTCDTITQVKTKILEQISFYQQENRSINSEECQLYLWTNVKSTNNSCSTSSSCSSSTGSSSNLPIRKKSLLTQFFFNRSMKYSTTTTTSTLNDPYRDAMLVLLNDVDNTNEQISQARKLNTLQHYGILSDGNELKLVLPKFRTPQKYINQLPNSPHFPRTLRSYQFDCQYCSLEHEKVFSFFNSSPIQKNSIDLPLSENDRATYCHLFHHTYEEIGESGNLLLNNSRSETYRLFETKSAIHSVLMNLIESLFDNVLHGDSYLNELIEQHPRFLHIFYGHFFPFLLKNLFCLFDTKIDKFLHSSMEIIGTIFQIACSNLSNEHRCWFCKENGKTASNLNSNIQNCTLLFADEIQRVRSLYANTERRFNNNNETSEYSSTTTGISRVFDVDPSIIQSLIEYTFSHIDEINQFLANRSADNKFLLQMFNILQTHRFIPERN